METTKNYTVQVTGQQGNPNWYETASTLLGAMRKARKEASMGISYVVIDPDGNPVKKLCAWQSLNRWGHNWGDVN